MGVGLLGLASVVEAKPKAPPEFCEVYPDIPACTSGTVDCQMCHLEPPARNAYGVQMESVLLVVTPRPLSDADFLERLAGSLAEVADMDADGDGISNLEELMAGSAPGDARSVPQGTQVCPKPSEGPGWDVCNYDARYVFKKLSLDFCGQSPTWDDMAAFDAREDLSLIHI